MEQIFLSRRNLLILLSKLDRKKAGEETSCTIVKYRNPGDPVCQSMDSITITAVEDEVLYSHRPAGEMNPADESKLNEQNKP